MRRDTFGRGGAGARDPSRFPRRVDYRRERSVTAPRGRSVRCRLRPVAPFISEVPWAGSRGAGPARRVGRIPVRCFVFPFIAYDIIVFFFFFLLCFYTCGRPPILWTVSWIIMIFFWYVSWISFSFHLHTSRRVHIRDIHVLFDHVEHRKWKIIQYLFSECPLSMSDKDYELQIVENDWPKNQNNFLKLLTIIGES